MASNVIGTITSIIRTKKCNDNSTKLSHIYYYEYNQTINKTCMVHFQGVKEGLRTISLPFTAIVQQKHQFHWPFWPWLNVQCKIYFYELVESQLEDSYVGRESQRRQKQFPAMGTYLSKSTNAEEFFPTKTDLAVKLLTNTLLKSPNANKIQMENQLYCCQSAHLSSLQDSGLRHGGMRGQEQK